VVERPNGTLKTWCAPLFGFTDRFVPTDQPAADRGEERDGPRTIKPTPVDPAELLSAAEMQAALGDVVRAYNAHHVHRRLGCSPQDAYEEGRRADARPGRDALHLLPPQALRVGAEGVVHQQDKRETVYAAFTETLILQRDTLVEARVDPWDRGLFVRVGGQIAFLEPNATWSEASGARRTAQLRAAPARAAAAQAAASRAQAGRRAPAPPLDDPDASDGGEWPDADPTAEVGSPVPPPDSGPSRRGAASVAGPTAGAVADVAAHTSGAGAPGAGSGPTWLAGDPLDRLQPRPGEEDDA
jgi:hypothetical protein